MALKDTLKTYAEEGWMPKMVEIWQEKIERLKVIDTGALHESFRTQYTELSQGAHINLKFAQYGIYQALGVGVGYKHGNGGNLEFMDPEYRHKHRLDKRRRVGPAWGGGKVSGKPRKRRDWFSSKMYRSAMVLKEAVASIAADEGIIVACNALHDLHEAIKK